MFWKQELYQQGVLPETHKGVIHEFTAKGHVMGGLRDEDNSLLLIRPLDTVLRQVAKDGEKGLWILMVNVSNVRKTEKEVKCGHKQNPEHLTLKK